jgi:hypothetical protein
MKQSNLGELLSAKTVHDEADMARVVLLRRKPVPEFIRGVGRIGETWFRMV